MTSTQERFCFGTGLPSRYVALAVDEARDALISDRVLVPGIIRHKELVTRLLASRCEICKNTDGISVHHVRRLADLNRPGQPPPTWAAQMAQRRRKTLVVCRTRHDAIHTRNPTPQLT